MTDLLNETLNATMQTSTTIVDAVISNISSSTTTILASNAAETAVKQTPLIEAINTILRIKLQNPWVLAILPLALIFLFWYVKKGNLKIRNILFFLTRTVIITLLIVALASPRLHQSKTEVKETPNVKILLDESSSMQLYGNRTGAMAIKLREDLMSMLENKTEASGKVSIETFSTGDKTAIGDELYKTLATTEGNNIIILLSDGNNNQGRNPADVARNLGRTNTTVYTIALTPDGKDTYIKEIRGESKVTSQQDYQMEVEVESTGASKEPVKYKLAVQADGREVTSYQITQAGETKTIPLTFSLTGVGVHKITTQITGEEGNQIEINDRMLKTVEVVEKPRIFIVTNKTSSPLKTVLQELYSTELGDRIPNNMEDYNVIYLDDVNANSISKSAIEKLREYILNGNGLAVVGGKNSFDYGNYNNSYFETLLPVLSMEKPVERRKQIAVVLLIDISGSTEYGVSDEYRMTSKIDFEKALAIKVLRSLDVNDSVAVLAFNTVPYKIYGLDTLGDKRVEIEDNIVKLQFGGGTEMLNGLQTAENMLKYYAVNKYVIVLSDGVIRTSSMPQVREKARAMSSEGIKIYTVGVGFDTDEVFMQSLADAGKGVYFKPEAYQRINIEFGRGVEEEKEGLYTIDTRDQHHFITRNTNVTAGIGGYNRVFEKSIAQLLLTTKGGSPVLTVWNFGLGRVAALTTDDGTLWAGNLYEKRNNKVISSMTNWVIGDLEKNKKVRITSADITLGETAAIRIDSKERPSIIATKDENRMELEVKSIGVDSYLTQFKPNETGFYSLTASIGDGSDASGIAVNYPAEYAELKPDLETLSTIARETGGRMYETAELEQLKVDSMEKIKKLSIKTIEEEKPLYPYIIMLALIIYFMDTVVRRIRDIMRLKE